MGYGIPPLGRHHSLYKLAREHALGRFVNVWFYTTYNATQLANSSYVEPIYYEMMAAHTFPKLFPNNSLYIGDDPTNIAFFNFVSKAAPILGARIHLPEVAVYYSSSSVLHDWTPNGPYNSNNQTHNLAFHGFGILLSALHIQWRPIPEWKLTAYLSTSSENIPANDPNNGISAFDRQMMKILVIPESISFPQENITALQNWVYAGGKLLVTGASGQFAGESGIFATLPQYSFAGLTGVGGPLVSNSSNPIPRNYGSGQVLYVPYNMGMTYWQAWSGRDALLPSLQAQLAPLLPVPQLVSVINTTSAKGINYIGANLFWELRGSFGFSFIDLNSYQVSSSIPATSVFFEVVWPPSLPTAVRTAVNVSVVSPEGQATATVLSWDDATGTQQGILRIRVDSMNRYASVVLAAPIQTDSSSASTLFTLGYAFWVALVFVILPYSILPRE